jgi:thiol-disulfide isomerase/thioredoxin
MLLVPVESDDSPGPSPAARCRGGSSERTVLIEVNTADWCVWCPGQKHSLDRLYNELGHDNLVILEYHASASDELTSAYAQQRSSYYGGLAYPAVGVDGGGPYNDNRLWESGSDMKYGKYDEDKALYNQERQGNAMSNMTIALTGNMTANTVSVKATIEATDPITVGNLWVRFVLYQNNIYHRDGNTNENFGILHRVFNHVVRDGFQTSLPPTFTMGDTFEAEHVFAINPFWYPSTDLRELGVVAFVQTDNKVPRGALFNAEVMQATSMEFVQSPIVLINKDQNDAYDDGFDRYDEFLTKAGLGHKNWDTMEAFETEMMNMRNPPTYGAIQDYAVQLWYTGSSGSTFDPPQMTAIDSGLSADQAIFVVGEEIAYQAFLTGSLAWLQGSLHADYIDDNAGAASVDGIAGDPISNGLMGLQIYGADPDVIMTTPSSFEVFRYVGVGTTAAVRAAHDSDSGVFYMAFNYFEGIGSYPPDPNYDPDGEVLMGNVRTYLDSISAPRVDVVQPDGGEVLTPGGQYEILWNAKDVDIPQDGIEIQYAEDSGAPMWVTIATGEPNDGVHLWDVPAIQTNKARVRVCALDSQAQSNCVTSDADFTIGTPGDTTPPTIQNVLVDGLTSATVVEGTPVALTAQISDFFTGSSNIGGANYTVGQQVWPGSAMTATDGTFDEVTEPVQATVDTTGWTPGDYYMYVYGWDDVPNYNTDSTAYATITIIGPDSSPPEISNVWIDGQPSQTYGLSTKPATVQLSAFIDDSTTGNSNIGAANYTMAPMAWPGTPMDPMDVAFDSPTETAILDIATPGVGFYDLFVYAEDIVPNYNYSSPFASLTILDDIAPEVSNVLIDGQPSATIPEGTLSVFLTATVDDSGTGNSAILSANYTVGTQAWPGAAMGPTDGSYDTSIEDVEATVDTSSFLPGFHNLCVYTLDAEMNENTTGLCAQLEVIVDATIPEITNVRIDGQAAKTVPLSTLPVICTLTATVDDTGTGGSNIGGANYTTPTPDNWPGTDMNPSDGSYDMPAEDVEASFSAPSTVGTFAYYVHAWDAKGNYNNSAPFAFLIIQDDIPPEISNVLVNGQPSISVSQGTLLTLTATASDAANGNSNIIVANYTEGFANWMSTVFMGPVDGSFDSPTEDLEVVIDTSGWTVGAYDIYVYAQDAADNGNVTSTLHVTIDITIPDTTPPEIMNARAGGNTWVGVNEEDLVVLNATVGDVGTGDSIIAGANYTVGIQNWPGTPMSAVDGVFDSSVEDVTATIDTTGWSRMNHTICIYAWDIVPNENTTSTECVYIEILSTRPVAPLMTGADLTGVGLVDVEIRFDRSGDDGLGWDDVVDYDIYEAIAYGGPYSYVTSVPATDSPTYSWTCFGCGVGDANAYFFYVEADNGALTMSTPNKASKFTQSLSEGAQLISIPLVLSSNDIAFALQTAQFDKAYYYDSTDASDPWKSYMPFKTYKGDLWTVDRTMALWINVTTAGDFAVAGLVPQSTAITLRAGWNLVGFPSFASAYTVADLKVDVNASNVEEPDPTALPYCLRKMTDSDAFLAGRGYWIEVPEDVTWTIVN